MHHIIYKTTCLITKKYYIGMHSSRSETDRYFGSGKIIAGSLKKHGTKNHTRETIATANSREELRLLEEQIVTADLLNDPLCMNLAVGGCGSGLGRVVTATTRQKMSKNRKAWAHIPQSIRERVRNELSVRQSARCGDLHPRAKTWILLSPENKIIRTNAMSEFCAGLGLNYFSLRNRAQFNDQRPITRGPSKGWSVLGCKPMMPERMID